ncbi:hypothetical protein [Streptosporangium sp. NBC_01756]|uniref:hypothetical protein n=1 Tax=Streptosporangium sp. NBC_01756 TaxID=2975950 RepID=UPI002DD8CD63|nr:hypothetical protein [Streptosporangium sp. NBC_01756]WSC88253.1 hypothetical protein OIE48_08725 [Streptosporangium sp. NBC_01756]
MRDRRDIFRTETGWRRLMAELQVPPTVRDSALERVARCSSATRAVLQASAMLQASAVLQAPSDEQLIAAMARLDEHTVRDSLAEALASGPMHETAHGAFAFRHVPASRAVADAVSVPTRRLLTASGRCGANETITAGPSPVRSRDFDGCRLPSQADRMSATVDQKIGLTLFQTVQCRSAGICGSS